MEEQECTAEFIDGSLTYDDCGCRECLDQTYDAIEYAVEDGSMTEEEALEAHAYNAFTIPGYIEEAE